MQPALAARTLRVDIFHIYFFKNQIPKMDGQFLGSQNNNDDDDDDDDDKNFKFTRGGVEV
jgi:hypothetical protein